MSIFSLAFWMRINLVVCVIDKPSIKVNVMENIIVEGETVDLYCATRNNHKTTSISWYAGNKKLISTSESSLNYKMGNVSRFDTGNYTCSVQNEIGNTSSEISLVISYPPVVNVRTRKLSEDSMLKEMQCITHGEPDIHNYFPWEHRSQFDEHIRYLGATDDRNRQLPEVNVSNIYQNTGFYICKVLNGIPDYHGNFLQQGRVYVEFEVKSSEEKALSSRKIINIVLLVIILVLVTGVGVYVMYMKYRYRKKVMTSINIQTAERNVDESTHYAEIIEGDSILTQPQGNNTQIISETYGIVAENSNTTVLSDKHSSASSNTDINASEDLDDDYEKPYTTMVANHGGKDEHVYRKTKQNWTYENSTTFKNATFEHLVEFSFDKTKTNVYANEGQESANMDYGENDSIEHV